MHSEASDPEASPNGIVLDASAILALLFDEAGAQSVVPHLSTGSLSAVNLSEVISVGVRSGGDFPGVRDAVAQLPLTVHALTVEHAHLAASLQPFAKSHNLSLGDRCCLALAMALGTPVLTADRKWAELSLPIEVRLIRP